MAGISSEALNFGQPENKKKYNGIELDKDLELNEYEAQFRDLDPQTARWWQIDPVTDGYENLSPYASMYDDPMQISDPLGNEGSDCCGWLSDLADAGKKILISASGILDGAINTASGGLISSDPFNFRKTFNEDEKGYFDGGVRVGKIIPLVSPLLGKPGTGTASEPEPVSANGVRLKTNETVIEPTPNRAQAKSNNSSGSTSENANTQPTTSRAARREVMRKENIPTSQQPVSQSRNASGREYTYETTSSGGKKVVKSVQQQTMDRSHQGDAHWEAGTVKTDQNGNVRTNSYGRPKLQNDKSKVSYQQ